MIYLHRLGIIKTSPLRLLLDELRKPHKNPQKRIKRLRQYLDVLHMQGGRYE